MAEQEWIVQRDGNSYPAADVATLQQWARSGNIKGGDEVWSPVRGEWLTATEIPELADLIVRPSAALPVATVSWASGECSGRTR
jgi:hypothetical protein